MQILLALRSKIPIYEQIITQVKQQILSGKLQDGDAIPSMRALAKTLNVSVITVQKAYDELQRDGYIDALVGRGTFVRAPDMDGIQREYRAAIATHVAEIKRLAHEGGISIAEIERLFAVS